MNILSTSCTHLQSSIRLLTAWVFVFFSVSSFGQNVNDKYPIVRTPQNVAVNYELPRDRLSDEEAIPVTFSKTPTDEEIYHVHFFEEPLVPSGTSKSDVENTDLVYALLAYSQRKSSDDFSMLNNFLNKYPKSRWQGSLLANLGIIYRRTGYYNMAIDAWKKSWIILKDIKEPKAKVLADRVISELLLINAWVGRVDTISSLLQEIKYRTIQGPAVERIIVLRKAFWVMKNRPGISFKCGPFALNKIFTLSESSKPFNKKMMDVKSTAKGFSLTQLQKMAFDIGLKYQMAYRKPGAPVIPKAVIHWKLDHYSTLLNNENGHFKCQDATMGTAYGQEFWLTPAALDSSASGYFLVPEGALPSGWRKVSALEGGTIFGKGVEPPDGGKHVTPDDSQSPDNDPSDDDNDDPDGPPYTDNTSDPDEPPNGCSSDPMAKSNVHASAVSLHIFDRPIYYSPPKGPAMHCNVDYHQKDPYQPANFTYSNLGPKWTFKWLSYIQDDPNNTTANADIYIEGGGDRTFVSFDTVTQSYAPELQTNDVLLRTCPNCYELRHPDGSKEIYARPDGNTSAGRKIFLTKKVDAAGNALTLTYDANLRITALKDALGQVTTIQYTNSDIYKITKVTDPFGRSAVFQYDASGRLGSITDMIGIVSSFQYDASDFINALTTPYGTTNFVSEETGYSSAVETHYPLGEKERVEFRDFAPGINDAEPIIPSGMNAYNEYLVYRNTFYWDRKAMRVAPGDYTKAKIYHWLHGSSATNENGSVAPILESEKQPLENRIWYNYQNQSFPIFANQGMSAKPSKIGRVFDNDTTQLYQYMYNELGKLTSSIDPVGRKFTYVYDTNKIDLKEVRQTKGTANTLLSKYTYNNQHLPLTSVDASGLTTRYTYNTAGQLLTVTNSKNETTKLTYDVKGYLINVTGPVTGSTVSFTYDKIGRVRTVTDPEGYTTTTDYDVLDRPTLITYPDSTYEQIVYNRLDAVHTRDRLGRWSHAIYDSLRRQNAALDALGRVTQFIWCSCGSLSEIIDPLKNITTFTRDLQGRLITKTFPDGKSTNYTYENTTSRLKQVTDAKGQKTLYTYNKDNNLNKISYSGAAIATPSVSYSYDASYNRITSMTDGTGKTAYAYKAANSGLGSMHLSLVDGPLSNDIINYNYDSLGRVSSRSIDGTALSVVYDKLGRITSETNALGMFGYSYVNQTQRLSSMSYPNGQSTAYSYFDNKGDQRLKEIWNKTSTNTTLSKYNYEYDKEGEITKWTQQSDAATPNYYELGYDLSDQLTSATLKNQSTAAIIKRYAYQYDKAGNRTSEQIDNTVTSAVYNNLNQLTRRQNGGPIRVKGTVNEFSSVLVKNTTTADSLFAPVDSATNSFEAFVKTAPGTNNITISATDYSGNNNKKVNSYSIIVGNGVNDTLSFDANGNTIKETNPAVTYGWDAADRLVKITKDNNVTEFVYDGLSRRIAEKLNGTIIKRWLWVGTELAEERDAGGGTVTKRFFTQGEQVSGVNHYFTKDYLGSVIEMTDAGGVLKARYSYDPYGRRTKVSGSIDADFGFTGHYYHIASGLYLTLYRTYDANLGSWLSRDPIAERGGINLYEYVKNDPDNLIDFYGLYDDFDVAQATFGATAILYGVAAVVFPELAIPLAVAQAITGGGAIAIPFLRPDTNNDLGKGQNNKTNSGNNNGCPINNNNPANQNGGTGNTQGSGMGNTQGSGTGNTQGGSGNTQGGSGNTNININININLR